MITLTIIAFGIAKDIVGGAEIQFEVPAQTTAAQLKELLLEQYPAFASLRSLAIARNNEYTQGAEIIGPEDELVLIPPVSGG